MRLGPLELRRAQAAAEPPPRAQKEIGASGTINMQGWLQEEEYNRDLQGSKRWETFERMQRSDGSVAEALGHIFEPIKNATWDVEPATPDPLDLEAAAFGRKALFDWPLDPWLETLDQVLDYLTMGHSIFETPQQVVEDELEFELPGEFDVDAQGRRTPKSQVVPARQFLCWQRFAPRLQRTIWKWNVEAGVLVSITQQAWKGANYSEVEIPASQLLVFTHHRRGDDFTGISLIRPAFKPWKFKELLEKIGVVAAERHGVGLIVAYPSQDHRDQATLDEMEKIAKNIRAGEQNYIVAADPKALGAQTQTGCLWEILTPDGGIPDFKPLIEYHRGEIKGALLTRFAELGHGQTGARATGDTQSEVWYDALHAVASYIAEVFTAALKPLVAANYDVKRFPKVTVSGIDSRSLTEFADAHYKLVNANAVKPDATYRAWMRNELDAPPEDEEQDKTAPEPPEPPAPPALPQDGKAPAPPGTEPLIEAE